MAASTVTSETWAAAWWSIQAWWAASARANLTRGKGGVGAQLTDENFIRSVRHGVGRDGRSLRIMPSQEFWVLTDTDTAALLAYVRSVPPVERDVPQTRIAFPLRALNAHGAHPGRRLAGSQVHALDGSRCIEGRGGRRPLGLPAISLRTTDRLSLECAPR